MSRIICNARVTVSTSDWDYQCSEEIASGRGFRITEDGRSDTNPIPGENSQHSPKYGTDLDDEHAYEDRYSCQCGRLNGKNYEHHICKFCKTEVKFVDIDLGITGWIILDKNVIIQPLYYMKLQSFIGKRNLENILKYKDIADREPSPSNKFDGIGMIEFSERLPEILEFFLKNTCKKMDLYMFLASHQSQIFVRSIPVYSSHLRPFIMRGEEIKFSKDDKMYKRIWSNSKLLNDEFELERKVERRYGTEYSEVGVTKKQSLKYFRRDRILFSIQTDVIKLWDFVFDTVKKKTGTIRNYILGGRLNFTARNTIVPDKDLRSDEIRIGYTTFLELYKMELISLLREIYDIPSTEAWDIWERATIVYDDRLYKLMLYMVNTRKDTIVEINRNPTINYGSQLVMRVGKVSPDITDHTMALPEAILRVLNADFDGDVLNILSIKVTSIANEYYRKLSPVYNIFISRNDGKYNADTTIFKDQAIGLYAFVNM